MVRVAEDLTGREFTRLRVLRRDWGVRATTWVCLCDPLLGGCGAETSVPAGALRNENTRSCGCLKMDVSRAKAVHGHSRKRQRTKEYATWCGMLSRCYSPSSTHFDRYGGRGITVCDRWRHDFGAFIADMGLRPSDKHSIDRYPDNDGNYEPGNCRWAARSEQMRNTSLNPTVVRDGKRTPLVDVAAESGVNLGTLKARLRRGLDLDTAVSLPPDKKRWHKRYTYGGQTLTLAEWERVVGIPRKTLNHRICNGWAVEHALSLPVVPGKRARRWGHGRWADLPAPNAAGASETPPPQATPRGGNATPAPESAPPDEHPPRRGRRGSR